MPQALITKIMIIYHGLACRNSYTLNLECINIAYWGMDKAEIERNWILGNR